MEHAEELETLRSIYDEDLKFCDLSGWYSILIKPNSNNNEVELDDSLTWEFKFQLIPEYPAERPPTFSLAAAWTTKRNIDEVTQYLQNDFFEPNEQVLFKWIEWLRNDSIDFLIKQNGSTAQLFNSSYHHSDSLSSSQDSLSSSIDQEDFSSFPMQIFSGSALTDRKSKFQAHAAVVHSQEEVDQFVRCLRSQRKIAQATHNIVAFRIILPNGTLSANRDDDGEGGAGDKLLYLLDRLRVQNVVVMVSRWYGGIQLGPDRFKHINDCARILLEEQNLIPQIEPPFKGGSGGAPSKGKASKR